VLSLVASMRSWLKYIGRALQLLTSVHVLPLFSDRRTPPRFASSSGGVHPGGGCGGSLPPPRPATNPCDGPPLLHQSKLPRPPAPRPPAPRPPATSGCPRPAPAARCAPGGVTAAAPGGVASVAAPGSVAGVGIGPPISPASICAYTTFGLDRDTSSAIRP